MGTGLTLGRMKFTMNAVRFYTGLTVGWLSLGREVA